jgi:hypothetical protein
MASIAINLNQWRESFKNQLPSGLRFAFYGGSKRELLKQIDVTLLVFNDTVINLESGQQTSLQQADVLDAESLARACGQLVTNDDQDSSILLLLPAAEFVATTVTMPGLNKETLASALQLQADTLLPSFDEKLALAVCPAEAEIDQSTIALWISENRLESLFQAFADNQMFLASVAPRQLSLADTAGNLNLVEADEHTATAVVMENGVLSSWLQTSKLDLGQEIFLKQWQQSIGPAENRLDLSKENATDTYQQSTTTSTAGRDYYFFPSGALAAKKQVEKGKRLILGIAAVSIVLFICALPFLAQTFEMRRLERSLDSQRALSVNAREDRAVVQNFEAEWGLINDFPEQDVSEAMFTLQNVLSPEQLTSMEVSEGIIQIEGESTDPQAILQRLEQHPLFTEVVFSRATNNSRYYIDLRLSTVNFEGYMVRHFPDN